MNVLSENEELVKLVDGAYKNILEKFNPCARQLITAGKAYLKALHGAVTASKAYVDALGKLARHAHQGTWGGCTDIGTALLQLVDVHKEIQNKQLNILKAFYVDLLVPLETNIDKDTKVVACEQKRFLQQQKCLQDAYLKAAGVVKKQRKKHKARPSNLDKEIKNLQQLEEDKMKFDCFCESSLKQAITQERRRFGFVLERQCSLAKHNLLYHSQGHNMLQQQLDEWEEVAKSRECLPEPIDKLFSPANALYKNGECAGVLGGGRLRKTRSVEASCADLREELPFPPLVRARSDCNLASSNASLVSDDYGVTLRAKSALEAMDAGGHCRVRALYSYLSSGEHQLSFHEGDCIVLIGDRNKGWQYGENLRNRRRGWFPIAYTAVLNDGPNVHPMDASALEMPRQRRSVDLPPHSTFVPRSRTTPDMQPPRIYPRPLSTFADVSFQCARSSTLLPVSPEGPSSGGAPTPSAAPAAGVTGEGRGPPRRLPPLPSLHSSSDSGFCTDALPSPLAPTSEIPRESIFSTIKLRKVITNDRSAPMIS